MHHRCDPRQLHRPGTVIAGYRIRRVLAVGGMGVVYHGVAIDDGAPVALKALLPQLASDPVLVRRFEREARAMGRLDHPGIVDVIDVVSDGLARYLVMPLVEGQTLDHLQAKRPLPPRRALLFTRQLLDALEHAHARRVIHRDLKPQNLMIVEERAPSAVVERVKVLNFGIAKILRDARASESFRLTQSGHTQGTPRYMAPEQCRRDDIDERTDLYAVGVLLFEMLTGVVPFDGPDDVSIMRGHVHEPAPFLGDVARGARFAIPALELLVATALAKAPERRFAHAAAMRDALDDVFAALERRGIL